MQRPVGAHVAMLVHETARLHDTQGLVHRSRYILIVYRHMPHDLLSVYDEQGAIGYSLKLVQYAVALGYPVTLVGEQRDLHLT